MKQVLIVSPHFPPINAPDMQRVRLALPHLRDHGWEPTVLAIAPESIEGGIREPLLEQTYPADIRVIRVRGIPAALTRWAGVGNLWWRCGGAVARAGDALLREKKFDLAFISTTQFGAFPLGPRWKWSAGLPFVVDYQDPWVNDYYARTGTRPPGGAVRFGLAQRRARHAEPPVLREAAGVIAVSDGYAQQLAQRYDWFDPARVTVLPFGASVRDFELARTHAPAAPLINFEDGNIHHVYAGRAGPDMELALTILFRAFRRFLATDEAVARKMRFHFIGTGYAPPPLGRNAVRPLAIAEGVGDFVHEERHRVPYFDALHYLQRADTLIAVGSDDPSYSASKLFPYILARRPLLLVFHRRSPVLSFAQQVAAGARFSFETQTDIDAVADDVQQRWFTAAAYRRYAPFNEEAFAPLMAPALTAKLAAVFDAAAGAKNT